MLTACKREGKIEIQTQKSVDSTDHLRVNIVQSVFTSADSEIQKSCDLLNAKVHYLIDSIQKASLYRRIHFIPVCYKMG